MQEQIPVLSPELEPEAEHLPVGLGEFREADGDLRHAEQDGEELQGGVFRRVGDVPLEHVRMDRRIA